MAIQMVNLSPLAQQKEVQKQILRAELAGHKVRAKILRQVYRELLALPQPDPALQNRVKPSPINRIEL